MSNILNVHSENYSKVENLISVIKLEVLIFQKLSETQSKLYLVGFMKKTIKCLFFIVHMLHYIFV